MAEIDFPTIIEKFDAILERGLCQGVGRADGQMCIEAAITQAMGLPFNDEPACVEPAVRRFKIRLNDSIYWKSPESRAKGLRDLGIAQIGSAGVVNGVKFSKRMAAKTIRILIPDLFRFLPSTKNSVRCLAAADRCEKDGNYDAAKEAQYAAADAAAADAAYAAAAAAVAAAYAAVAAAAKEKYLLLSASLALETLRELKSPGCEWL